MAQRLRWERQPMKLVLPETRSPSLPPTTLRVARETAQRSLP